ARSPLREVIQLTGGGRLWLPSGGDTLYATARDGESKQGVILRIDVASGTTKELLREDKVYGSVFGIDVAGSTIVYAAQDGQHPVDLWQSDAAFAAPRRVTHVNPGLERYEFGRTRLIEWHDSDGALLRGALLLPAGHRE